MTDEPVTRETSPATAIVVTLAVLALTVVVLPLGLFDWIYEHCDNDALCAPLIAAVETVERASDLVGIADFLEDRSDETKEALGIDAY